MRRSCSRSSDHQRRFACLLLVFPLDGVARRRLGESFRLQIADADCRLIFNQTSTSDFQTPKPLSRIIGPATILSFPSPPPLRRSTTDRQPRRRGTPRFGGGASPASPLRDHSFELPPSHSEARSDTVADLFPANLAVATQPNQAAPESFWRGLHDEVPALRNRPHLCCFRRCGLH